MRVVVLGAGGHAKVVLATFSAAKICVECVLDDEPALLGSSILGIRVEGPVSLLSDIDSPCAVIAIGSNQVRKRLAESLHAEWITVIHPSAWVSPDARLGPGAMIMAGVTIQPGAIIGAHAIVNTGATVDHDCTIGEYAHVAPGAHLAGNVSVGEGALIGVGVSAIPGVSVGAWSVVGAGAAIVRDLASRVVACGVPARSVRK